MRLVERFDRTLAGIEKVLVALLTGGIAAIMMAQVILRYFFSAPLFWAEEMAVQLLVFVSVFGLSLLTRQAGLVSIDFFPRALTGRAQQLLLAVLALLMLAIVVWLMWLSWNWVIRPDVRIELSATMQLPRWYSYAVLPVGLSCMAWHQMAALLRHVHAAVAGTEAVSMRVSA